MRIRILSATITGMLLAGVLNSPAFAENTSGNASGSTTNISPNVVEAPPDDIATEQRFKELDANHDGIVSKNEAKGATVLSEKFSEADANADGSLTAGEFAQFDKLESPRASDVSGAAQGDAANSSQGQSNQPSSQDESTVIRTR